MRSLWERLMYRMEYRGSYEKDGQVCHKYIKTRRFPRFSKKRLFIALFVVFASLVTCMIVWMALEQSSGPPHEAPAANP